RNSLTPWSYSGKPMVSSERDLERVLGLQPDLVLYNRVGTLDSGVDRLREAGIPIFDLGPMLGVSSLIGDLRTVATLAQVPERGDQIARTWLARLERLASHIPEDQRPRALYLGLHGGKVFGGTRGSSYYDLLRYAGLVDVAAAEYTGWPAYDAEQVLALDPDLIVTQSETVDTVCDKVGLEQLRACRGVGGARIVGVPAAVLVDPGFGVLDSAELLHEAVFGSRGATTLKPRITPLR
ncbi:MAG: iron complex transport system substrate-binding protein, partial [Myxococcota bacterium]